MSNIEAIRTIVSESATKHESAYLGRRDAYYGRLTDYGTKSRFTLAEVNELLKLAAEQAYSNGARDALYGVENAIIGMARNNPSNPSNPNI